MENCIKKSAESKFFHIFACAYVMFLTMSFTLTARLIPLHIPFTHYNIVFTGATLLMPVTFFLQNIITEVYGYIKSRQVTQIAILLVAIYALTAQLLSALPDPHIVNHAANINEAYRSLYHTLPRHLLGLIAAVFVGSIINDYLLSKAKITYSGRYLGIRFIVASSVGEAFYQVIGIFVWAGALQLTTELLPFILFSYIYKVLFEIAMTPFNYVICSFMKKYENMDTYDYGINYNPFAW